MHRDDAGILVLQAMTSELARLEVRDPAGVFAARQLGRGLAAEPGWSARTRSGWLPR